MTQDQTSAGTAAEAEEDDANPSFSAPRAAGDLVNLLGDALINDLALPEDWREADTTDDAPAVDESDDDGDDDAGDDDLAAELPSEDEATDDDAEVEPPTADTSRAPKAPSPEQLAEWVESVAANQRQISRIPAKHQPAVLEALLTRERGIQVTAVQAAHEYGLQQGRAAYEREIRDRLLVETTRQLESDDPETYVAWRRMNPGEAQQYDRLTAPPAPADAAAMAYLSAGAELSAQISREPAVYAAVAADKQANPHLYTPDAAGLAHLTRIAERARTSTPTAPASNPATIEALDRRKAARSKVAALPRPDTSPGRRAPKELSDDPMELISSGIAKVFASPAGQRRTAG